MRITFETKDHLRKPYTVQREVTIERTGDNHGPVVAFMCAQDCVNATKLALLSLERTQALKPIDRLVLFDNGSRLGHTARAMRQFIARRGEGAFVSYRGGLQHGHVMEMLIHCGVMDGARTLILLDNDIMVRNGAVLDRMLDQLHGHFAVGKLIPWRNWPDAPDQPWKCAPLLNLWMCVYDYLIFRETMLDVGAELYRDYEKGILYDTTALGFERITSTGMPYKQFEPGEYAHHWGSVTWARRPKSGHEDRMEKHYQQITQQLRDWGVPEDELFDDRWQPSQ